MKKRFLFPICSAHVLCNLTGNYTITIEGYEGLTNLTSVVGRYNWKTAPYIYKPNAITTLPLFDGSENRPENEKHPKNAIKLHTRAPKIKFSEGGADFREHPFLYVAKDGRNPLLKKILYEKIS